MDIRLNGLYLDRIGRQIGIKADRGQFEKWRWLTTRDYYVTVDGRASLSGGEVREDLVRDIAPTAEEVQGADSMFGCLAPTVR